MVVIIICTDFILVVVVVVVVVGVLNITIVLCHLMLQTLCDLINEAIVEFHKAIGWNNGDG